MENKPTVFELMDAIPSSDTTKIDPTIWDNFQMTLADYNTELNSPTKIETYGDIQDLLNLMNNHRIIDNFFQAHPDTIRAHKTVFEEVLLVWHYLNSLVSTDKVITWENAMELKGSFEMVRTTYPRLWTLFEVWVLG